MEKPGDFGGNCRSFQVRLYRDGDHVKTEKVKKTSYNFSSQMNREGDYTFEVRAVYGSQESDWSEESDVHYTRGHSSSGSNSSSSSGTVISSGGPGETPGGAWIQASDSSGKWWYRHANGSYTASGWEQIGGKMVLLRRLRLDGNRMGSLEWKYLLLFK